MLKESTGVIQSPVENGVYVDNEECIWTIQAPPGYIIHLTWLSFNLEYHPNCVHDYVNIYENYTTPNENIIATYVRIVPIILLFLTVINKKLILLLSSKKVSNIIITIICCITYAYFISNFALQKMLLLLHIIYVIIIYFRYCGNTKPPDLMTQERTLTILFHTDSSVSGDGFTATYIFADVTKVCGGHYLKPNGVIRSPNYPEHYPYQKDCVWIIQAQNRHRIMLTINHFELEEHTNCAFDYLEIR